MLIRRMAAPRPPPSSCSRKKSGEMTLTTCGNDGEGSRRSMPLYLLAKIVVLFGGMSVAASIQTGTDQSVYAEERYTQEVGVVRLTTQGHNSGPYSLYFK